MSESVKAKGALKLAFSKAQEVTIASPVPGERRPNRKLIGRVANRPPGTQNLLPILAPSSDDRRFTRLYFALPFFTARASLQCSNELILSLLEQQAGHGYDLCKRMRPALPERRSWQGSVEAMSRVMGVEYA